MPGKEIAESKQDIVIENHIIDILIAWLEARGWSIESYCKGKQKGIDILATRKKQTIIIEAKGARGNPDDVNTKRLKFESGQLFNHLGVAVMKVIKERIKRPNSQIVIAHPDDKYVKKILAPVIPDLQAIGIQFLWVNVNGKVIREPNKRN